MAPSSLRTDTMGVKEFCLDNVLGPVYTTQKVTIPQFSTISVHGNTSVRGHCMWVHVLKEPTPGPQLPTTVVPTVTYGVTSGVLWGTHLSVQLKHPFHQNPHKDCDWSGHAC